MCLYGMFNGKTLNIFSLIIKKPSYLYTQYDPINLLKLLADGKTLISLFACFFYWTGLLLVNGKFSSPDLVHLIIIFFSTHAVYRISPNQKISIMIIVELLTVSCLAVLFLSSIEILYLLHLALIAFLYNVPKPVKFEGIRKLPFLKIFIVAYVWAAMASFFPALQIGESFSSEVYHVFWANFFFILSLMLLFDVRDIKEDQQKSLATFASIFGVKVSKMLALACATFFMAIITIGFHAHFFMIVPYLSILIASFMTRKEVSPYFYTIVIDGLIIVYFVVTSFEYMA